MQRELLSSFFDLSPAVRLLRAAHAALIIDFLHLTFKSGGHTSLGQRELRIRLRTFLEDIHQNDPEMMNASPERYLHDWVEAGWLQRFLESFKSEPQYQLSRHAEDAIRFAESSLRKMRGMVGTESRLLLIMNTLDDVVRGASADREQRLAFLRTQQETLNREIADIESGEHIQSYRPSQIRERFQTTIDLLRALQADFRAVEEKFEIIAREVLQMQSGGKQARCGILSFALDAEEQLKQSDEGQSFFGFVDFLLSPAQQSMLRQSIEAIQQLEALADENESMQDLRSMLPALLAEAEKVMHTTAKLSSALRKIVEAQSSPERMRVANVLQSIKLAALQLRDDLPTNITCRLISGASLTSPMARRFWTPSNSFNPATLESHVFSHAEAADVVDMLRQLKRLDYRALRKLIQAQTYAGANCTLSQLFAELPESPDILELLALLQIAHEDGHSIDLTEFEILELKRDCTEGMNGGFLRLRVPLVRFQPKASLLGQRPK
ncbi:MAG: DUF3375 family protein [Planctomycetales bacterium]|nr:DUF3375 family protein [Planctomycetales bacterium]